MGNDDEFGSSRDRHHHQKKSSSRKREDIETSEEKGDLRTRLNELKKTTKDHSTDRDHVHKSSSSHHRTKQVHDYEPYHKSTLNPSSANTPAEGESYKRSSQHSRHSERSKKYSPEKDKASQSKYTSSSRQHSSKPSRIIKDAEVNEIISEEEEKSSDSDVVVSESLGKEKEAINETEANRSDGQEKSGHHTESEEEKEADAEDMDVREAKLKAKLKENFLKNQLDKKYKDSKSIKSRSNSANNSRSSSTSNEMAFKDEQQDHDDLMILMRSNEGDMAGRSDNKSDTDRSDNSGKSTGSEAERRGKKAKKTRKAHGKRRKGSVGSGSEGSRSEDNDSHSVDSSSKKEATRKKAKRSPSPSSTHLREKPTDMMSDESLPPSEDHIQAPPPPLMYYCATQGCRSVEEFECLNKIEEGAYGVVYRAKDKKSNVVVALKRLKMEKEREGFPITSIREVDTLLKSQHVNVVTVREIVVGSNMDKIYMVMDYVEHDLKSLMQHSMKKPFQMSEVKCLAKQMLSGIAHLHDNWIIHRDLKTSNLLLSHKGVLKIADFGLAREYGSPLKEYTPVVVTLWYRCPELLLNTRKYSTSVDMWSVGTIFGELMLLKALFPGKNEKDQLDKIFKDLGTPNDKIWPGFKDLPLTQQLQFPNFPYNTLRSRFGKYLSENGFELINKLLTYDPVRRISAEDALKHEFFRETPLPIEPSLFPTWPAKSEGVAKFKKVADSEPRAPSAGKMYEQLLQDDNSFVLQFPAQAGGFTLR